MGGCFPMSNIAYLVTGFKNFFVTDNMERLYMSNLPLLRKFIKPYINYEPEEDLMQEAYFGLLEAIKHYETSKNVLL